MSAKPIRRALLGLVLAPVALGLAACGTKEGESALPKGEAIAKIAPPAGQAWSEVVNESPEGGMVIGNPQAPIKVIEYGSLSCPHCAKLAEEGFGPLVSNYIASGRVSLEFRSFAIHPQDVPLTVLARCSTKEAFFPLVEQIYANFDAMNAPYNDQAVMKRAEAAMQLAPEQRWGAFADAVGYTQFFAQRGIAVDQAKACLADPARAKTVADQAQKYGNDGVTGTPTLLINGTKLDDITWRSLEAALQNAGAR